LLGEMLLLTGDPAGALREFQATLKKEPNRFRAMYGAAKAASLSGDRKLAQAHYQALLKMCANADQPGRPELAEARSAVR
jgi:Tfp pilus assembly protein PilF